MFGMGAGMPTSFFRTSTDLYLWFQAVGSSKILSLLRPHPILLASGRPGALSQNPSPSQGPAPSPRFTAWLVQSFQSI
jgi:hypothetical protein